MSWDIFIQRYPVSARRVADIPDSFAAAPIGGRADVIAKLSAAFPRADLSDPSWGVLSTDDYSIEFGLGDEDPVQGITLHVRGDDSVVPQITRVLHVFGLRAIDSWTGEFFDPQVAPQSLAHWRNYLEEGV
ncbi:MAG TPA: hypothetical protein VLU46_16290 [Thermoanaerobaculia bacterium]|nr:hypothetical protein [Thermoanaerobaculia bacterium]